MLKKILMTALMSSFVLLTGCPSPEEVAQQQERAKAITESNLANPETIGTLADGRAVSRFVVKPLNSYEHDHYVYFIDNASVSTNYEVRSGKTTHNETRVSLSSSPTTDEIIALAEQLKQQQKSADEAEFARLKQKLGQ